MEVVLVTRVISAARMEGLRGLQIELAGTGAVLDGPVYQRHVTPPEIQKVTDWY